MSQAINTAEAAEVAPLAGAWIEIARVVLNVNGADLVAPLAGAWIEILMLQTNLI